MSHAVQPRVISHVTGWSKYISDRRQQRTLTSTCGKGQMMFDMIQERIFMGEPKCYGISAMELPRKM